jgi:hypothetical protein
MRKGLMVLAIVAFAALFLGGCAAKEEKAAHADIKGKTITIGTGNFYEACDEWTPGDKVNFSFTTTKPVTFNVHYHEKHVKKYTIKDTVVDEFGGSFVVESKNIHCCMWKNDNSKYVTLTYDMSVDKE